MSARLRAESTLKLRLFKRTPGISPCMQTMASQITAGSPEQEARNVENCAVAWSDLALLATRTAQWGKPSADPTGHPSPALLAVYNSQPGEKRVALNGQTYTRMQFQQLYGNTWHYYWLLSKVRRIAWDDCAYTVQEFMEYYGDDWKDVWKNARPQAVWV